MQFRHVRYVPLIASALLASCVCKQHGSAAGADERDQITHAMERYQADARASNFAAMADHFAPDGMLLEPGIAPIRTHAAIREFLTSFPGAKVEIATATPESIDVFGDTAYLWGAYFEKLSFPGQPVSEQHGEFVVEWTRTSGDGWKIKRMLRVPVATMEMESPL